MPDTTLEDFQKKVIKVATKAAARHGWCEEVDRLLAEDLGLAEFMPPRYAVQSLASAKHRKWVDTYETYDTLADAKSDACGERAYYLRADRYSFSSNNAYERVNLTLTENSDLAAIQKQLEAAMKRVHKTAEDIKNFKAPAYPKYRVVERRGKTDTVIYEVTDEEAAKHL